MKQKDKLMTEEEHLESAKDLAIAVHHITKIWKRCDNHYPKTHPLMKEMDRYVMHSTCFSSVKHLLEEESVKVGVIDKHGFIYYHLEDLYKEIEQCTHIR